MQNNKWIIKGLTKLYIHVHVLIDIFMFTAANARWHFKTKLRIQVLMKIAGGVQYMIWDGTNSEHIVLAQSQYASPNYNKLYIQANVGTSILLSHIHGIQDQNVQTIKVFFFCKTILWIFRHCNRGNKIARVIRFTSLCSQKCIVL